MLRSLSFINIIIIIFGHMTCEILASLTRDRTCPLAMEGRSLNHWIPPGKSVEPVLFAIFPELWGDHLGNSVVALEF